MRFRLGLVHPSTSSLLTCECGITLDAAGVHMTRCPFGGQRIATHDAIRDVVFAMAREGGYLTWRERWYALQSTRVRADTFWFGRTRSLVG
ncbi:hypothetical protein Mapa_001469 [Marchantia paleacea]|nr:hypothetical protein Mapa_001469 [Marchantia paleacea]